MCNTLGRLFRLAALAMTVSLACGSVAWGQSWAQYDDDDRYRHDQAREQGFHRGLDNGSRAGQFDAQRGRRFNFKTMTGKTHADTSTGWAARANTSRPIAKATSADTAAPSTTIADIAMTTAVATATTGASHTEQ